MANNQVSTSRAAVPPEIVRSYLSLFSTAPNLPSQNRSENSNLRSPPTIERIEISKTKSRAFEPRIIENYSSIWEADDPERVQSRYLSDARFGHGSTASSQPLVSGSGTTADFGRSNSDHLGSSIGTPPAFAAVSVPTGECLKKYLIQNYDKPLNYNSTVSPQNTTVSSTCSQVKELSNITDHFQKSNVISSGRVVNSQGVPAVSVWKSERNQSRAFPPLAKQQVQDGSANQKAQLPYSPVIRPSIMLENMENEQISQATNSYENGRFPLLKASASPLVEARNHHYELLRNRRIPKDSMKTDSLGGVSDVAKGQNDEDQASQLDLGAARKRHNDWKLKNVPQKKQKGLCDCCVQ